MCQIDVYRVASGLDAATSDLLASVGLQKLMGGSREAGSPQAQALDGRVRAAVCALGLVATGRRRLELDRRGGFQSVQREATATSAPGPSGP